MCPVFLDALKEALPKTVVAREFNCHINDAQFANAIVEQVLAHTQNRTTAAV
jgi:uncharacterized protein (UPF0261 family)